MDSTKHLVRGKDTVTGEWRVGYLVMIDGKPHIIENRDISEVGHHFQQEGDRPTWVDPKTVGRIAPRNDSDGKQVFEGDIIQYEDEYYYFDVTAEVKYGEYMQDGSGGEYGGAKCSGWYVSVVNAIPPEWDEEAEYQEYLKNTSIFEIPPTFKVIENKFD